MLSRLRSLKILPMITVIGALSLGACSSLNHSDRTLLAQHGVGGYLYDKMKHGDPLELGDIIELSRRGLPTRFIVEYLRDTHFIYRLKPEDVQRLRSAGVAQNIIEYMLATPGMFGPRIGPPYGPGPYGPGPYGYGPYGPRPYWRYRHW